MAKQILFALLVMIAPHVLAAEFESLGFQEDDALCPYLGADSCVFLNMEGAIEKGDSDWLENYIEDLKSKVEGIHVRVGAIYINSSGGDVFEAMRFGRILRENRIQLIVPLDYKCFSACVILLSGAVTRLTPGEVGVHSFYSPEMMRRGFDYEKESEKYQGVLEVVGSYLDEMRMSRQILDEMLRTPPSVMNTLSMEKKREYSLYGWDPIFHQLLKNNNYIGKE